MKETYKINSICVFWLFNYYLIIGVLYELLYFNIVEFVLWMFVFFVEFFYQVDSYESTCRIYESSL